MTFVANPSVFTHNGFALELYLTEFTLQKVMMENGDERKGTNIIIHFQEAELFILKMD